MAHQIQKLTIKRFKQLDSFDIDLGGTTVLIGANNSGKSSVLQALHFAVSVAQSAKLLGGQGVRWGADRYELSFNPSQLLYSPIADVLALAKGGQLQERDGAIEITIECSDGSKCAVSVLRGRNRNIAVSLSGRALGERLMDMDEPFTIYAPGLAGIPREERYMSPGVVRRSVARGDANLVLRNVLLMLEEAQGEEFQRRVQLVQKKELPSVRDGGWKGLWEQFQTGMRELFDGISFEIKFDRKRDENIEVFFTRPGKPRLPIDAAGTSVLQASQILAYITLFKPSVLILDEPDSHLHANNQRALCNLITDLAAKQGFRALISTHSRHVLDALRDRASVVWVNDGAKVDFGSVSTAAMLMELGALDSVDYFAGGHIKCLFATEDSSPESIAALRALLESNWFKLAETDIRPYSGCTKIDSAKILGGFLADKAPRIKFALHRDRDYMPDAAAEQFESQLNSVGALPFLTASSDAEGYFLNPEHLAHLNAGLTVARASELLDEATAATRGKTIEKMINLRLDYENRNRKGGTTPNAGAIAMAAAADFDADPAKWRRGKVVLGELKSLLQKELGSHAVILKPSPHLIRPELAAIHRAVWGVSASPADAKSPESRPGSWAIALSAPAKEVPAEPS